MTKTNGTAVVLQGGAVLVMEQISAIVPRERENMPPAAYFNGGFIYLTDSDYERIRQWMLHQLAMLP